MANPGKQFEADLKASVPEGVYFLRLTDSAIGFDVSQSTQRFAPKSPYDCILYKKPIMYALELKSTISTSLSFKGKSPMIKEHQLKKLREAAAKGVKAGFMINFRKSGNTYYLPIEEFDNITQYGMINKSSINEYDIASNGKATKIEARLKKVKYSYNLAPLFQ